MLDDQLRQLLIEADRAAGALPVRPPAEIARLALRPRRLGAAGVMLTLALALLPPLAIAAAALTLGDYGLAMPGWFDTVRAAIAQTGVLVAAVLAVVLALAYRPGRLPRIAAAAACGAASLAVALITSNSLLASHVDLEALRREELIQGHRWVSYDSVFYWPENQAATTGRPAQEPTAAQIRTELTALRAAGFTGLVLHECRTTAVPPIARELGFGAVIQGIRVADPRRPDAPETQEQIRNAIEVAPFVDGYFLGELSAREADLLGLKSQLALLRWKTRKPVTACFLHQDYEGRRGDALRELEDFSVRSLNRPWTGNDGDPDRAVDAVRDALRALRQDSKPGLLTTVFYPSGGGPAFTEDNQHQFFHGVLALERDNQIPRGVNLVYFNSFDRPWAQKLSETTPYTPAFEGHTGLFRVRISDDQKDAEFIPKKAVALFAESK